jgi:DNA repair protein RadA/Sms
MGLEIIPVSRVLDAIIAALPGGLRQKSNPDDEDEMTED